MLKKLVSGTNYTLNQDEQSLILNMAAEICSQDRSLFVNNYKVDKSTQTESIQTEQSTQTDQMDRVGHPIVMPNTSLLM